MLGASPNYHRTASKLHHIADPMPKSPSAKIVNSKEFEHALKSMAAMLGKRPISNSQDSLSLVRQNYYDDGARAMTSACEAHASGSAEAAWSHLVDAAYRIGCLTGAESANYLHEESLGLAEVLGKNGRLGGLNKGRNSEQMRERAAAALIKAAPNGKWPTLSEFQQCYHGIVAKVEGFNDTDYQMRRIMQRADVKASLPPAVRGRR